MTGVFTEVLPCQKRYRVLISYKIAATISSHLNAKSGTLGLIEVKPKMLIFATAKVIKLYAIITLYIFAV